MAATKLTRSQVARLGGLGTAKKRGSEGMAVIGARGGLATAEKHGTDHYVRAAHKRWGRLAERAAR
jgi:hypothetical protein